MRLLPLLGPALGAIVGGVVGALVTVWVTAPKATKKATEPAVAEEKVAPTSDVEDRVAALERAVLRLEQRRLVAAAAQASAQPSGEPAKANSGDSSPIIDDPVFEAAVRDVIERLEEERQAERELERGERRRQRAEEWASGLASTLRLSDQQKTKVSEIASQYFESLRSLRSSNERARDREAFRQQVAELRAQAEAKLGQVLDGSQLRAYQELDERDRLGPRPPRERFRGREGAEAREGRRERPN